MNFGTVWLNHIIWLERKAETTGLLPAVEQFTILPKLLAINLERLLRTESNTGLD